MAKHTLKILLCEQRKIFKVCLPFINMKGLKNSDKNLTNIERNFQILNRNDNDNNFIQVF